MKELKVIALTHKNVDLEHIALYQLNDDNEAETLRNIKKALDFDELAYLNTCNRVEFVFAADRHICLGQTAQVLQIIADANGKTFDDGILRQIDIFEGKAAAEHMMRVSSSLNSMVVGEREIITQMRKAFERSRELQISGDSLRIAFQAAIKTAKQVYSETAIAEKPVSVASLAWQRLKQKNLHQNTSVVCVGAGQTIQKMLRFFAKSDNVDLHIFNRTLANAQTLANEYSAQAGDLNDFENFTGPFDVLLICTGATEAIVRAENFTRIKNNAPQNTTIIDLGLPANVSADVANRADVHYDGMKELQTVANANLASRQAEVAKCEAIIEVALDEYGALNQQRKVELAMSQIPNAIKEIKETALGEVFAKDLENLDDQSKEMIEKIVTYMEKKYISLPMKMAKEVLMREALKN